MFTLDAWPRSAAGHGGRQGLQTPSSARLREAHPVHDAPMCANIAPVRIAIRAGLDVHASACDRGQEERCSQFDTCLKQQNRREVSEAEVIVAPYDALFTGFASDTGSIGLLVVDEGGVWQRAATEVSIALDAFGARSIVGLKRWGSKDRNAGRMADLNDARQRLFNVLSDVGPGPDRAVGASQGRIDSRSLPDSRSPRGRARRGSGSAPGACRWRPGPGAEEVANAHRGAAYGARGVARPRGAG